MWVGSVGTRQDTEMSLCIAKQVGCPGLRQSIETVESFIYLAMVRLVVRRLAA